MSVGIRADVAEAGRQPEPTGGGRMSVVIVPVATVGCSDRADGPGVVLHPRCGHRRRTCGQLADIVAADCRLPAETQLLTTSFHDNSHRRAPTGFPRPRVEIRSPPSRSGTADMRP